MACGVGQCRNCWQQRLLRPKGLCWKCYFTPGVRALYTPVSPRGNRFHDAQAEGAVPDEATQALPRSEAKLAELARRVQMRQALHCSGDSVIPD
jgi:hypothetical protein